MKDFDPEFQENCHSESKISQFRAGIFLNFVDLLFELRFRLKWWPMMEAHIPSGFLMQQDSEASKSLPCKGARAELDSGKIIPEFRRYPRAWGVNNCGNCDFAGPNFVGRQGPCSVANQLTRIHQFKLTSFFFLNQEYKSSDSMIVALRARCRTSIGRPAGLRPLEGSRT